MKKPIIMLLTSYLLSAAFSSAYADDDQDKAKRMMDAGDILPLKVILQKARDIQPGKVLDVEIENKNGKKIYEIELLNPEGRVIELKFDARTGKHLSTENED
jgi:uncharacterized membrane protein YkoI